VAFGGGVERPRVDRHFAGQRASLGRLAVWCFSILRPGAGWSKRGLSGKLAVGGRSTREEKCASMRQKP
jgi:hypothetical protein